jgi:hypothetical protein
MVLARTLTGSHHVAPLAVAAVAEEEEVVVVGDLRISLETGAPVLHHRSR